MTTRHAFAATTLGKLLLVADEGALTGVYFPHHWYLPKPDSIGAEVELTADALLTEAATQLEDYFTGHRTTFELPLATRGNAFQERVWAMLREIPYGETTTYGALAVRMGRRSFAQNVGQAVGHNPISVIIPCHRVVGRDGKLTGYAGGLDRKRFLLDLEEPEVTRLF
jgi:methylated-DNA-[protein]-cysteine S-methyltransferase